MKIALINGSPKSKLSASEVILNDLRGCFSENAEVVRFNFRKSFLTDEVIDTLFNFDILIFAFPLYVDGIPSHLLNCLCQIEEKAKNNKDKSIAVYAIANCGFFEGHQNRISLDIMKNWCTKAGLVWGQGIGIGGGGALGSLANIPLGAGPKKSLGVAFKSLGDNVATRSQADNIFVSINFPRILYKIMGELGWRQDIKKNGLKVKDLSLRL